MERILAAFDKCKESLSAHELCRISRDIIQQKFPCCTVVEAPLTDGGEGFVNILTKSASGSFYDFSALDSVGKPILVRIGVCDLSKLKPKILKENLRVYVYKLSSNLDKLL